MKHQLILATLLIAGIPLTYAQDDYYDDIYYNPKKDKSQTETVSKKKQSNYIADFSSVDVDAYNRRGEQYYASPIDTIGSYVENGEDFVYTQQIQKYYNPTIVVDNADVLGDVLANAYGNVEIVIDDDGLPIFTPYYGYGWGYPYSWRYSNWGLNVGPWGWSVGFYDPWYAWNWGPSWSWGWGPSWAWGPSWNWGWGPGWGSSWGWGPAWGGHPGGRPPMASWRPNGNTNVGPRPGWSSNTRPGGNIASHRPGTATNRPGTSLTRPANSVSRPGSTVTRPNTTHAGVVNNNGRWEYNTTGTTGHRQAGTGVVNSTNRNNTGNNVTNRVGTTNRNNSTNRNNTTTRSYNNTNNNRSYNYNRGTTTNRSTGGSFGGGMRNSGGSRSGGGGGRHR